MSQQATTYLEGIDLSISETSSHTPEEIKAEMVQAFQEAVREHEAAKAMMKNYEENSISFTNSESSSNISNGSDQPIARNGGETAPEREANFRSINYDSFFETSSGTNLSTYTEAESTSARDLYTGLSRRQILRLPKRHQGGTTEPTKAQIMEAVNNKRKEALAQGNKEAVKFWSGILDQLKNGTSIANLNNADYNQRFRDLYNRLLEKVSDSSQDKCHVHWEGVKAKMIQKIESHIKTNPAEKNYYKNLLFALKNRRDIQALFDSYDELYALMQSVMELPEFPLSFSITTSETYYPNLSPKTVYPKLGVEELYLFMGISLEEIIINAGIGEVTKDSNGNYPALNEGQWYDYDRELNPTKPNSSFWRASVYNTLNDRPFMYNSIAQRHAYYKFVDAYLKAKGIISEWFDAAAIVTMYSITDSLSGETALGAAEGWNLWYLSKDSEEFLKGGNRYLFAENMRNAKSIWKGEGTLSGEFIDANGQPQSFKDLTKEELGYKLVEFEQTLVQEYLDSYLDELSKEEDLEKIIQQINGNFSHWMAPDIMQDIMVEHFSEEGKIVFNFSSYAHRVKLGQIMVKELYYLRDKDVFVGLIDALKADPVCFAVSPSQETFSNYKKVAPRTKHLKDYYKSANTSFDRIINIYENFNTLREEWKAGELEVLESTLQILIEELLIELREAFSDYVDKLKSLKRMFEEYIERIAMYAENPEMFVEVVEEQIRALWEEFKQFIQEKMEKLYQGIKDLPESIFHTIFEINTTIYESIKDIPQYLDELGENAEQLKEWIMGAFVQLEEYWDDPEKMWKDVKEYAKEEIDERVLKDLDDNAIRMLTKTAIAIYPELKNLDKDDFNRHIHKSANATVGILLYEFANGTKTPLRKFNYGQHPFANALFDENKSRLIDEILEEAIDILERDNYDFRNMPNSETYLLSQEFSPGGLLMSLDKHLDSNLAQFFLAGSITYFYIKDGKMVGKIYNETGRKSFMLHIGKNYSAPNSELSTIKQEIYFTFDLNLLKLQI